MSFYEQNTNVIRLHNFPRFGHSNQLSSLADEDDKDDYISGLKGFPMIAICFFFAWSMVLLLLKWRGTRRVGCAAGGEPIHMTALREQGVRRWQRRQRMIRSWRIQNIFAISAFGLITFSFVFVNQGLTPFIVSLEDVSTVTNLVQTRTRHGMHLAHLLSSYMHNLRPHLDLNVTELCPHYDVTFLETLLSISITAKEVVYAGKEMDSFLGNDLDPFLYGIDEVAVACGTIDSAISTVKENDWMIRLFLTSVNIINVFLIAGVVLTRNKVKAYLYQEVLGLIFIPAFVATMVFAVMVLCLVSATGMVNADFCAGGEGQGSPLGTIVELVAGNGYDREGFITRVLDYYTEQECDGANPLIFLADLEIALVEASGRMHEILFSFEKGDFESLSEQCGARFEHVNTTFSEMAPILSDITKAMERVNDLTKCDQVSPVLEDVAHGAVCHETINSLTWMFYTALTMAVLIMIMLSTRAALFNTLIPGSKKKRREKEFRQYKRFMQDFGFDTQEWQMDPEKTKNPCGGSLLDTRTKTFDTEDTDFLRITPVSRDDNSENSFMDEPTTPSSRLEPEGLQTVAEVLNESFYDHAEGDSNESVDSSVDSDDSSLNPPSSVMSGMASTFTSSVSSAMKKLRGWASTFSSVNMSMDTSANGQRHSLQQPHTPTKVPANILGPMDTSESEMEEVDNLETVPLSPRYVPAAPQKSLKSLRRTRGSTQLSW